MPNREFEEWIVFFNLFPFGEKRADIRAGMSFAPIINLLRQVFHKDPVFMQESEWSLDTTTEKVEQPWQDIRDSLRAFAKSFNSGKT